MVRRSKFQTQAREMSEVIREHKKTEALLRKELASAKVLNEGLLQDAEAGHQALKIANTAFHMSLDKEASDSFEKMTLSDKAVVIRGNMELLYNKWQTEVLSCRRINCMH